MKPILITGAAGKTGRVVVHELLARGVEVRAMVRRVDARSKALAAAGAEVVVADLHDYVQLRAVLRATSRAYFIPPWDANALDSAVAFAAAARDAKIEAVVELSQWLSSPEHPSLYTRQHWLINRMFSMMPDVAHVTVNPGLFADNLLVPGILRNTAHFGIYPVPVPRDMVHAPPSNEDIGRVGAALLLDPFPHAGRSYRPTGPKLIGTDDIVATLAKIFKRPVRVISPVPEAILMCVLAHGGYAPNQRADISAYYKESSAWEINAPNTVVRDLTGREAEDFETVARRYAASPELALTPLNVLQSVLYSLQQFFSTVEMPAHFLKRQGYWQPQRPRLSSASEMWFREHGPGEAAGPVSTNRMLIS